MLYGVIDSLNTAMEDLLCMKSDVITVTRCKDCAWFAPIDSLPAARELHEKLLNILGDCLTKREGECGICRKVTYSKDRPVLTNSCGYCHRAEPREQDGAPAENEK